ncbi:MAG: hypothetical protein IT160_18210 [Bryobacterales bacterium]|nr:hypothetical protein [Bryobacterales bacterium]
MEEPEIGKELEKMEYEPLLPVEKKLIAWSLITGILAIGFLAWLRHLLF